MTMTGINRLKEHAVQLARQDVTEKIEELRNTGGYTDEAGRGHLKANVLAKLKRH